MNQNHLNLFFTVLILPALTFCNGFGVFALASPLPLPSPQAAPTPLSKPALTPKGAASHSKVLFDHLEQDTVFFKAPEGASPPKPLKTNLFDLNYLGTLQGPEGDWPYFLFTAKPCQNCLDDRAIYALRPLNEKPSSYVFPGRVIDSKKRVLVFVSQAFFGKCLLKKGNVFVIFQKEKIDRRRSLQPSVLIAEPAQDHLQETLLERHFPAIKTTLQFVKKGVCHEVPGRNRMTLNVHFDLHSKNSSSPEEDEDEENADETTKTISSH